MAGNEQTTLGAVVMAAGLGTRMQSDTPKHLHSLLGRRMVDWVLDAAKNIGAEPVVVVASPATAVTATGRPSSVVAPGASGSSTGAPLDSPPAVSTPVTVPSSSTIHPTRAATPRRSPRPP